MELNAGERKVGVGVVDSTPAPLCACAPCDWEGMCGEG
jgi:hypothetical protein